MIPGVTKNPKSFDNKGYFSLTFRSFEDWLMLYSLAQIIANLLAEGERECTQSIYAVVLPEVSTSLPLKLFWAKSVA